MEDYRAWHGRLLEIIARCIHVYDNPFRGDMDYCEAVFSMEGWSIRYQEDDEFRSRVDDLLMRVSELLLESFEVSDES